ncbi:cytochrome P450 [Peniophora sp. CONT]|nr:cytochrome P450 [Peniophora sp. CONT]
MAHELVEETIRRLPFALGVLALLAVASYYIVPLLLPDVLPELKIPSGARLIGGHLQQILHPAHSPVVHERLIRDYGRNTCIQGLHPGDRRLLPLDPVTLAHVMKHPEQYEKPEISREIITRFIGLGMLSAEGAVHRRQRRVAAPAFGVQNLRALVPLVFGLSEQMKDRWLSLASEAEAASTTKERGIVLDIVNWMSRATFDVIGLAGFDYHFNAIQHEKDELFVAYRDMFEIGVAQSQRSRSLIKVIFPFLNWLFPDDYTRVIVSSHEVIYRIARKLIADKKARIASAEASGVPYERKDLLTLMLRSNASTDLSPDQRMTDDDMLNSINTFMFAGSDTTSLALTWTLVLLAKHPEWQARLRRELRSVPRPAVLDDEGVHELWKDIDRLPDLDKVCRESLRLISPVHSTLRVATEDDYMPVSKPYEGRDGRVHNGVTIKKGTIVHVPVEGMNLDKGYWGPDAWKFIPDRWDNLPEAVAELPGLYSNTLTFSGGPRSCIGQKFSMVEMKTFLYTLLCNLSFAEAEQQTVVKANVVLIRPYVRGKFEEGSRCPLRVTPYVPGDDEPTSV